MTYKTGENSIAGHVVDSVGTGPANDDIPSEEPREPPNTSGNKRITLAIGLASIIFCLGAFAIIILTNYFLVVNDGKGGACAQTTGRAIWIYCIFRLVATCFAGTVCKAEADEENAGKQFLTAGCRYSLALTSWIYGGIVIYGTNVCDQFKNTGLYKLASAVYVIDVTVGSLGIIYQLLFPAPAPDTAAREHQKDATGNHQVGKYQNDDIAKWRAQAVEREKQKKAKERGEVVQIVVERPLEMEKSPAAAKYQKDDLAEWRAQAVEREKQKKAKDGDVEANRV